MIAFTKLGVARGVLRVRSAQFCSNLGDIGYTDISVHFSAACRFISLAMSDKQPLMGGATAPPPPYQAGKTFLFKKPQRTRCSTPLSLLSLQLPLRSRATAMADSRLRIIR